ncbi:MAG: lipocalin-like domain-containing protein [Thermodesulfobacteriota bacterium]
MKDFLKRSLLELISLIIMMGCLFSGKLMSAQTNEWKQATEPWKWIFPRDHGSHPEFRTEWWYFTGNLNDSLKKSYGFQLTFFRQGIFPKAKDIKSPWSIRDVYLAHFTLTDVSKRQFWFSERASRKGPGLSGASEKEMDIWLLNWRAKMERKRIGLEARHQEMVLSLDLYPRKPIIFHGANGLSQKGPGKGQASYYFSYTDLEIKGKIKTPLSQEPFQVDGIGWFDHEFGSNQLDSNQIGWDWFSLHLSDGQDLMIYLLREKDGTIEPSSSGTLVKRSGEGIHLTLSDIRVEVLDYWKSSKSGGRYPSRWRIKVPSYRIELDVSPLVSSQELITESSTGIIYWEGAVEGMGRSAGKPIACKGYIELTGYARTLGGLF